MATTIQQLIDFARFQLQDEQAGAYRYSDAKFIQATALAMDEAYRIRPDFFVREPEPIIIGAPTSTEVPVPRGYLMAFVFFICGYVSMSNQEDTEDARATVFLNKFVAQLTTTAS